MDSFIEHGVSITENRTREKMIVFTRGKKYKPSLFKEICRAYNTDEFIISQGRSINGFLNALDRLADKVNSATIARARPICETEGHKFKKQLDASGTWTDLIVCSVKGCRYCTYDKRVLLPIPVKEDCFELIG